MFAGSRRSNVVLVVLATTLTGGAASAQEPLSLAWIDAASAAAGCERAARDEAVKLLRTMGVEASWRTAGVGETARDGELRVILLDRAAVDRAGSPVLGSTPQRFEGAPFFWVHVPGVRGVLGFEPQRRPGLGDPRERFVVGIALGRVIAHEVVHALAPAIPHSSGLMAPRLRKTDLVASKLAVPEELARAFRAALADAAVQRADAVVAEPSASSAASAGLLTLGAERVAFP
jgi:hypothetical protein